MMMETGWEWSRRQNKKEGEGRHNEVRKSWIRRFFRLRKSEKEETREKRNFKQEWKEKKEGRSGRGKRDLMFSLTHSLFVAYFFINQSSESNTKSESEEVTQIHEKGIETQIFQEEEMEWRDWSIWTCSLLYWYFIFFYFSPSSPMSFFSHPLVLIFLLKKRSRRGWIIVKEHLEREREKKKSRREGNRSWFISCNGSSHVLCLSSPPSSTLKKTNSFFLPKYGLHFLSLQLDLLPFPLPCPSFFLWFYFFQTNYLIDRLKTFFPSALLLFFGKKQNSIFRFFAFSPLAFFITLEEGFSLFPLSPPPVRFFGSASTLLLLPSQSLPVSWFTSLVSAETHKLYFPLLPPPFLSSSLSLSLFLFSC